MSRRNEAQVNFTYLIEINLKKNSNTRVIDGDQSGRSPKR
jgi:hypothetical protein